MIRFSILLSMISLGLADLHAQGHANYKVAIFLYNGVELLDFSGPGEVFGATNGFDVYTLSVDGEEVLSQGFVTIKPEYSIDTAPLPDLVVYPGGAASASANDPRVMSWAQKLSEKGAIQMSVCTGARILAAAGLLDGLNVTTWYGFTGELQKLLPTATVLENTRFVDSGNILTTAGVSAGIDGALHLVDRIMGKEIAEGTAKYMEYDKWERGDGQVDYENPLITSIRSQGVEQVFTTLEISPVSGKPTFFEGEMKNLGLDYLEQKEWTKAAMVFKLVIKKYPRSVASFEALGQCYANLNKFSPINEQAFLELALSDADQAVDAFRKAREMYPGWMMFRESYLNYAGYQHLQKGNYEMAIRLFQLNVEVFPDSPNVYDSLGEAYLASGDKNLALVNYKKALELDPKMESAKKAVEKLSAQVVGG